MPDRPAPGRSLPGRRSETSPPAASLRRTRRRCSRSEPSRTRSAGRARRSTRGCTAERHVVRIDHSEIDRFDRRQTAPVASRLRARPAGRDRVARGSTQPARRCAKRGARSESPRGVGGATRMWRSDALGARCARAGLDAALIASPRAGRARRRAESSNRLCKSPLGRSGSESSLATRWPPPWRSECRATALGTSRGPGAAADRRRLRPGRTLRARRMRPALGATMVPITIHTAGSCVILVAKDSLTCGRQRDHLL
jgi:hypothetical protein